MTQYFASNSLAGMFRTSTAIVEATTAGRFDTAYTPLAISIPGAGSDYASTQALPSAATGTQWIRFDWYVPTLTSTATPGIIQVMSGSTGVFRTLQTGVGPNHTMQCQYWNGSAWTNTGATFALTVSTLYTLAVKIIHNTSFEFYANGSLMTSGSGWTGSPTSSDSVRFYSSGNSNASFLSQLMWADYDIRDSHLLNAALNGNSATNTGGTGTFTDINETVLNETTAEAIAISTNKMGQTKASITVPGGYNIKGMVIAGRGRVNGTITNGKYGIRSGGVNYSSANQNFAAAYEPRVYISAVDPNTGTDFTQANFNSAEIYFEAV